MINTVSVTGIVSHIGTADNFQRLLKSINNLLFPHSGFSAVRTSVDVVLTKLTLFWQSCCCPCKVDVVRTKLTLFVQSWRCSYQVWTLFVQSRRCPCKVDVVRTKCEHYSYKVVVVLAKLTLFVQSVNIIRTKLSLPLQSWRCSYKVDVVLCTKFCTKKEESWQVNIDIKTASYQGTFLLFFISINSLYYILSQSAYINDRQQPQISQDHQHEHLQGRSN